MAETSLLPIPATNFCTAAMHPVNSMRTGVRYAIKHKRSEVNIASTTRQPA